MIAQESLASVRPEAVDELWAWLEAVMLDLHTCEASRLVRGNCKAQCSIGARSHPPAHKLQAVMRSEVVTAASRAEQHEACAPSPNRISSVDRLKEDAQHLCPTTPAPCASPARHSHAALAAAVGSQGSVQADVMRRSLYILLSVAAMLRTQHDTILAQVGSVISAALGMIVAEVQWLTCLLQLTHGACSPHLRCACAARVVLSEHEALLTAAPVQGAASSVDSPGARDQDARGAAVTCGRHAGRA